MLDATGTCQKCGRQIAPSHARWFASLGDVRVAKCQHCGPWTEAEKMQAAYALMARRQQGSRLGGCNCRGSR